MKSADTIPGKPSCRFCAAPLEQTFVDLGMSPLCETLIEPSALNAMERFYPLHVYVCGSCYLVQLEEFVAREEIFSSEYPYFSSFSDSWVEHARRYVAQTCDRFGLAAGSLVMEIASNDGYLLQHVVERGISALGIEPAGNVAEAARAKGIPTEVAFFGVETAERIAAAHGRPDLLIGNNVLAHVPDINDFVGGMQRLLGEGGVITMEFPHLLELMGETQFDTIYHEHFCYLSLGCVQRIFAHHGLTLFDVEKLTTHGGSLRIYACHQGDESHPPGDAVAQLLDDERASGLESLAAYRDFADRVVALKRDILDFLIEAKRAGKSVAGYGAPGKGNTLLNYCGIRTDFLDYTVDRNFHKQGCFTAGCHIPIHAPEHIRDTQPDYLFVLPWNLKTEIMAQTAYIREWGGQWVLPIPEVQVVS